MLRASAKAYYHAHKNDPAFKEKLKESGRAWYYSPRGKAWFKKWRKNNRVKQRAYNRAWSIKNPEKWRAHRALRRALLAGIVVKSLCEICFEKKVEAHHDDYSQPLDVRWLCRKCHVKVHPHTKKKALDKNATSM
jgi:hypothetical protein